MSVGQQDRRDERLDDLERRLVSEIQAIHRMAERAAEPLVQHLLALRAIRPRPMAVDVSQLSETMRNSMLQQLKAEG